MKPACRQLSLTWAAFNSVIELPPQPRPYRIIALTITWTNDAGAQSEWLTVQYTWGKIALVIHCIGTLVSPGVNAVESFSSMGGGTATIPDILIDSNMTIALSSAGLNHHWTTELSVLIADEE